MPRCVAVVMFLLVALAAPAQEAPATRPNIVLIFADDLGYGDLGCFGSTTIPTPNLDAMAARGVRLTSFCVAQAVCSASRAALLTGCYPNRVGVLGALFPGSKAHLPRDYPTIAEILKQHGYVTGMVGKWHLGDHAPHLPLHRGFDAYTGLAYSNDMWSDPRPGWEWKQQERYKDLPLRLIEGNEPKRTIATLEDQAGLTEIYTRRALEFMEHHRERPFFLYVAHSMPHVPIAASEPFRGKSRQGPYGDVIAEIDASTGRILEALRRFGLTERTLVIFTSDNGPWLPYGTHAGTAGPLREGKGTTFEGGVRVPFVAQWPGRIPEGVASATLVTALDVLPTILALAELPPREGKIDGHDRSGVLLGKADDAGAESSFAYFWGKELRAVRQGPWKLVLPHAYRTLDGKPGGKDGMPAPTVQASIGLSLFHLEEDVAESKDVSASHPEVVARLQALAERFIENR